jgi:hypothetical protein
MARASVSELRNIHSQESNFTGENAMDEQEQHCAVITFAVAIWVLHF